LPNQSAATNSLLDQRDDLIAEFLIIDIDIDRDEIATQKPGAQCVGIWSLPHPAGWIL
jgi:hypothetical protein